MSNLIKAAEELEYVPKETLIQMAQSGDSRFPPYLVLAEIQRRTQNEKAYSAMRPPATTTVAEEKVAEFAQSGLGGMVSPPFSPPEDLPMSPPMQMAASGGLTGYANTGSTALDSTFQSTYDDQFIDIYGSGLGSRLFGLLGKKDRAIRDKIQSRPEYLRTFQGIADADLFGFGPRGRESFNERMFKKSLSDSMLMGEGEFKGALRAGVDEGKITQTTADKLLGFYTVQPDENLTNESNLTSDQGDQGDQDNQGNQGNQETNEFTIQEVEQKDNESKVPTPDVFGTLDEIKKRMQNVEYTAPTAEKLKSDRTAETLMYLGSLIAGTTNRKEFGEGLADLTSKVIASKKADDRFLTEAKLKERGLFSSDLQLAAALETLKVKALQARNAEMKADIDLAQILAMQLNTTVNPEQREQIEKRLNDLISPYLSSSAANVATSDDGAKIVETAKN